MVFVRWLIGGLIGAAIGAVVWVSIGYALNAEVGYVAWGIGFLCGLGVQLVGGEHDGYVPGFVALLCAALSILVSKYLVISILISSAMGDAPGIDLGPENMIAFFSEQIIAEKESSGKKVKLPPAYEDEDAPVQQRFPKAIWRDAKKKWDELAPNEQTAMIEEREQIFNDAMEEIGGVMKQQAFMESFNAFDLLWFGLAAFTAFRVGSGLAGEDD